LLQLSNSSLFEFPKPVISVTHAASLLGMTTLKGLVLADGLASEFTTADPAGLALMERVGRHARAVAILSRTIAVDLDAPGLADIAFLSGLLHDVGQLVVFAASPALYARVEKRSVAEGLSFQAAMEAECGCTTLNIGAYLLGLWGVPKDIVCAVMNHRHTPTDAEPLCPATIVHIADRLANEIDFIADLESPKPRPATSFPATCSDNHLTAWRALVRQNSLSNGVAASATL
jgi:HD-like signal output (HDOD) protein